MMSATVAVENRGKTEWTSSGRKAEFSVKEVEAVIAALSDKVARLQKDIGALKRTSAHASHRDSTDMPTKLTYAARSHEKKAADRREPRSFSGEQATSGTADSPGAALSCRAGASNNDACTTTRLQQRKHALFNARRKNRAARPQEVSDGDAQYNALHPNASDFTPPPQNRNSSPRRVLRKRISRGIQYETQDCQVTKYRVSMKCFQLKNSEMKKPRQTNRQETGGESKARRDDARSIDKRRDTSAVRNMDEQTGTEVAWRGIDNDERRDGQDAGRYADVVVAERNRPPVVEAVTTPHRRANLNEATAKPSDSRPDKRLDRDTGAPKSTDGKFDESHEDVARVESKKENDVATKRRISGTKKKVTSRKEKVNEQIDDDAPKDQPIINNKKANDSNVDSKNIKSLKTNKKDKDLKTHEMEGSKLSSKILNLSKITVKKKNTPGKNESSSVIKKSDDGKSQIFSKKKFMKKKKSVSLKDEKHQSQSQTIKNNSKSSDSIEPQYISIKNKLNNCTKELNQLIGKVSDLFRKKNSKSK